MTHSMTSALSIASDMASRVEPFIASISNQSLRIRIQSQTGQYRAGPTCMKLHVQLYYGRSRSGLPVPSPLQLPH
eukprot:SAG31_NODE_307_length_17957_cov_5.236645_17_plen_75_part_00